MVVIEESRNPAAVHAPVLVEPVAEFVGRLVTAQRAAREPVLLLDATLGAGGHSEALLARFERLRVIGCDQDEEILALAAQRLARFAGRIEIARARHSELRAELAKRALVPQAVLFDLGASSLQLDRPERGFSFQADGPLDMRMDVRRERTAADVINTWDESDLADLFYFEGGESGARRIARAVVDARRRAPFRRTLALADLIERTLGGRHGRLHPATKVFQALRRAVNEETEELACALASAEELLPEGGMLLAISFHSGEDGVVKRFLLEGEQAGRWVMLTHKPVEAERSEVLANPRARSARLRVALRRRAAAGGAR